MAHINGIWIGKSFDRAIQETKQIMEANSGWYEYNDSSMKLAYQAAERRLAQLQAASC